MKIWIASLYCLILIKSWFLAGKPATQRIGKYNFKANNYSSIKALYESLFLRNNYYFESSSNEPLIIDCGANIGGSLLYFKTLYPMCQILCFEPSTSAFKTLRTNMKQFNGVKAWHIALSDSNKKIEFFELPDSLMSGIHSKDGYQKTNAKGRKLSDFIDKRVDLLKLDVEGSEYQIVKDLCESGKIKYIDKIAIEYHHHINGHNSAVGAFLKMLEDQGFSYQLSTTCMPLCSKLKYQDMIIYAYRNS